MESNRKKGAAVVAVIVLLGLAGAAAAAASDDDDDDEPDIIPAIPVDPGIPDTPVDPADVDPLGPIDPIDPPDEPPEPDPPAPDPLKKNYVGSGYNWPHQDQFPQSGGGTTGAGCCRTFGLALQQLGYPANPAAADWNVISGAFMAIVREFQRDYNLARTAQTVDEPAPKGIGTDGKIGKNTIDAIINAKRWVLILGLTWEDIVGLA